MALLMGMIETESMQDDENHLLKMLNTTCPTFHTFDVLGALSYTLFSHVHAELA